MFGVLWCVGKRMRVRGADDAGANDKKLCRQRNDRASTKTTYFTGRHSQLRGERDNSLRNRVSTGFWPRNEFTHSRTRANLCLINRCIHGDFGAGETFVRIVTAVPNTAAEVTRKRRNDSPSSDSADAVRQDTAKRYGRYGRRHQRFAANESRPCSKPTGRGQPATTQNNCWIETETSSADLL